MNKKIFIGAAWPYANNSLHLGHVASLIGADVIARFERLCGNDVLYVSGSDCHGTPIVISAEQNDTTASEIAKKYHEEFKSNLIDSLGFSYDIYTTTLTQNHEKVVQEFFLKLYDQGLIYKKKQELPYCDNCKRFLPDRYIEGKCPICSFENARGDQCDECSTILDPEQLIDPQCKQCGSKPTWKESEHFFLKLTAFEKKLLDFVENSVGWRADAKNSSVKLIEGGLRDRAITRDTTWGIKIPISGYDDKRIYVWFDAVCGYYSASKQWAEQSGGKVDDFWSDDKAIHYYIHGKDNIPFHSVIWPAILLGQKDLHLPDRIFSSEYLTLEGKQFSKSRSWAVWLPDFLREFDPDTLRYYLISNGPETSDADFSWNDFALKVNKELIGNFGNFIYRTLSLIKNNFPDGVKISDNLSQQTEAFKNLIDDCFDECEKLIRQGNFKNAIKKVFTIVEFGNKFLVEQKPWEKIKTEKAVAKDDLAICAYAIASLGVLISPFLPKTSEKIFKNFDGDFKLTWQPLEITDFKVSSEIAPIFKKIEDEVIEEQVAKLGK